MKYYVKAVSRTSNAGRGMNPELDFPLFAKFAKPSIKGQRPKKYKDVLNNAEPLLIKSDEAP